MDRFKGLSNVIESPLELGDMLRTVTPSFLRKQEDEDVFSTCCPSLGLKHRILGWLSCFLLGLFLQATSFGSITQALLGHPARFAIIYTTGNIVSLAGTFFLAGPARQCRNMAQQKRARTT
eukprot:CAMPEP_0180651254 /NCGR_PEP_ID=MMETSP1037_2-20121125/52752_1 /TAXON_ID=632150 /ORGANISM="Azadinium spinosum, Strain 3D9" /LENGTH=120 /DNA_ID=CAMNT_0022676821 /DNA_START=106 /DNA_END=465 /DNA_ORIENTATION=+